MYHKRCYENKGLCIQMNLFVLELWLHLKGHHIQLCTKSTYEQLDTNLCLQYVEFSLVHTFEYFRGQLFLAHQPVNSFPLKNSSIKLPSTKWRSHICIICEKSWSFTYEEVFLANWDIFDVGQLCDKNWESLKSNFRTKFHDWPPVELNIMKDFNKKIGFLISSLSCSNEK